MSDTGLVNLLSKMKIEELKCISSELQKIIQCKEHEQCATKTESEPTEEYLTLNRLNLIIDQQSELVNEVTYGQDPIEMESQRCNLDTCSAVGNCNDCGNKTCLHKIYEEDRICIICEVKQIKEGRRTKAVYRP